MAFETLRELAISFSKVQKQEVDLLTEETPFLKLVPFSAATHDMWHNASVLDSASTMEVSAMDAPLPIITSRKKLARFELGAMGGIIEVPEQLAKQYGGVAKYFEDHTRPVIKNTGMAIERSILYYSLRQYAIDNQEAKNRSVYDAGGTGDVNYSIIGVRFEEGVCQGLYNPNGFGNATLFDREPMNGGGLYKVGTDKQVGYGVRLRNEWGFMTIGTRNVGAIVNIDLTIAADTGKMKAAPTSTMIDDTLSDIRASSSGRTVMVMHHKMKTALVRLFKDKEIEYRPGDKYIDRTVEAWGDVPLITSYNMLEAKEKKVTVK